MIFWSNCRSLTKRPLLSKLTGIVHLGKGLSIMERNWESLSLCLTYAAVFYWADVTNIVCSVKEVLCSGQKWLSTVLMGVRTRSIHSPSLNAKITSHYTTVALLLNNIIIGAYITTMKSTSSLTIAVHEERDDNDVVRQIFTFQGRVYGSYDDAVKAKRQRIAAELVKVQEAKAAIDTGVPQPTMAPAQKEQRDGSSSSQPAAAAELREQPKRRCKKMTPPSSSTSTCTSPVAPAAAGYHNGGEMLSSDSEDEYEYEDEDASTNPPTRSVLFF